MRQSAANPVGRLPIPSAEGGGKCGRFRQLSVASSSAVNSSSWLSSLIRVRASTSNSRPMTEASTSDSRVDQRVAGDDLVGVILVQPGTGDAVQASKDMDLGSVSNFPVDIAPGTGDAIRASIDVGAR